MVLSRWSPFLTVTPAANRIPVDVQRTEDGYRFQAALPGYEPENVEVTLEHDVLTISARRSGEKETEQGRYLRREVYTGSFTRRFALPAEITADDVKATFANGLLTVEVKESPARQAVKIPVTGPALPEQTQQTAA